MARPKLADGRPSLGPRDHFNVAVPEVVGDAIRDLAAQRGQSLNTVISEALVAHFSVESTSLTSDRQTEQLALPA